MHFVGEDDTDKDADWAKTINLLMLEMRQIDKADAKKYKVDAKKEEDTA